MKRFGKQLMMLGVVGCLLLTTGLGCKGLSDEEKRSVRPITLEYWTVHNNVGQLRKFAQEYKQVYPYVTINVKQVRYEEFEKLFVNALADDVPPDLVSMHVHWLRQYTNRLAPMPTAIQVSRYHVKGQYAKEVVVTQETKSMPTRDAIKRNFVKTVSDDVVVGGRVYGLPLALDTLAIYYNTDLLDRSGVALPPMTWDEFLTAVRKATRFDSRGRIIQSGVALGTGDNIDNSFDILSLFMMQNGVTPARGTTVAFHDGLRTATVSNHPMLQSLRFYTDFARETKDVYAWNEDMGNAFDAFVRGKSVFYIGYAHDYARIRGRAPQMNIDIIPVPQLNQQKPVNVANYWIEGVVKKSKQQQHAWNFVRYMTLSSKIKEYSDAVKQPSPMRVHIEEQKEDKILEPFATQMLFVTNWYHGRNIDAAEQAFDSLIRAYLQPYGERETPKERDARLISNTARVVQQTF